MREKTTESPGSTKKNKMAYVFHPKFFSPSKMLFPIIDDDPKTADNFEVLGIRASDEPKEIVEVRQSWIDSLKDCGGSYSGKVGALVVETTRESAEKKLRAIKEVKFREQKLFK